MSSHPPEPAFTRHHRHLAAAAMTRAAASAVSGAFAVPAVRLFAETRCQARTALARQVAIYLGRVGLGLSYTDLGRGFGRDRTTAAHACRLVEDRREDVALDCILDHLESALVAWTRTFGSLA